MPARASICRPDISSQVANEESLLLNKRTAYQGTCHSAPTSEIFDLSYKNVNIDATKEKLTRGVLKSYVDQKLNNRSVVILDSLNYIKGFRYELHCMSRELRSSHCVVWVRSDERLAEDWNRSRPEECSYEDSL